MSRYFELSISEQVMISLNLYVHAKKLNTSRQGPEFSSNKLLEHDIIAIGPHVCGRPRYGLCLVDGWSLRL